MHICQDEIIAFFASLPFLGYFLMRGKHLWHRIWHRGTPKADGCCPPGHKHEEHTETISAEPAKH